MALDEKTLAVLKEKLLVEKAHLEAELSVFAKKTDTTGNYETQIEEIGTDEEDNTTEVEGYVDNLGLENNLEAQLKDVNDALDKMDKGVYGVCEKTGEAIPENRLMVYPSARTLA
ncbi:MAG: hypothetical protein GW815_03480 [Candidatus Moranbacteria bacterium]|nr:hypothetical protein [Candidatus Moranbacteria bacterium]OIQ03127.1 MAG: hypothetical protein AUK58_02380 [Candidatus Moranbacteria bacterium CG2_30_41_165]PJC00525.1 MAG: hypothetical protein CO075_00150 [Candidatus Moranbacteria bacterium CG_4_9_14_0_8_um_filter_41_43]